MAKNFVQAKVYKSLLNEPIRFITYVSPQDIEPETTEIIFHPNDEISIVLFSSGGGGGFSPATIYETRIKGVDGSIQNFEEIRLYREKTPISDFIQKNRDVLFELVSKI
jgi:hypothetical protein